MSIQQTLQKEIEDTKTWYDRTKEECIYKRDLEKRIELLNWTLDNLKNPDIDICALIEAKTNEVIDKINEKDSIIEADPLDSEVRILDWILYVVCTDRIKKFERLPGRIK